MSTSTSKAAPAPQHSPLISADDLASRLRTGSIAVLLDVRGEDEHSTWAIPGSLNIPLDVLPARLSELPHNSAIAVYCASGGRSARAAELLNAAGQEVSDLAGGITAWSRSYDTAALDLDVAQVIQFRRRGKGCLSYLIVIDDQVLVVDPSSAIGQYQLYCHDHDLQLAGVIDTHLHADHISGARALAAASGAKLFLNSGEGYLFEHEDAHDHRKIALGDSGVAVQVHAAPGHTGGSVLLDVEGQILFSGDTLFVDGIGRPDLADAVEKDATALHETLESLVTEFNDDTWVLPAHCKTTLPVTDTSVVAAQLRTIRENVPELRARAEDFVRAARAAVSARPTNYQQLVELNRSGGPVDEQASSLEIGPNRCAL